MDHSVLCCLTWAVILLWGGTIQATPFISSLSMEGSGSREDAKAELMPSPSVVSKSPEDLEPTTISTDKERTQMDHYLLTKMVDFLRENLFLILVITCLLLVTFFILCSAVVLSRRRKVNAYYPCSFPTKMYVDETDKAGGGRFFSEVPEKQARSSVEELVNSAKQLQDDIILATRNLRSPTKAPWREDKDEKPATEEKSPKPEGQKETSSEEEKLQQCVSSETNPEMSSTTSQSVASGCHMEKSDPSSTDLPPESQHSSFSDDSEAQEETHKQEAASSSVAPFISEEKTTF